MQAATEQVQGLFDRLIAQARTTLKSPEMDAIHDFRVAIRRFLQGLAVFDNALRAGAAAKLHKRLKHLLTLAGGVRDCDISAKLASKKMDEPDLARNLERRRSAAVKEWKSATREWLARHDTLPFKPDAPQTTPDEVAAATLPAAVKDFFGHGKEAAAENVRPRELHRFRIAAKKFRYTLELFAEIHGPAMDARNADLRVLQTALGDINDCRAARALLKELGAAEPVLDALRKKQRKRTEEFRRIWEERFAPRATRRAWLDAF